jgi:archaellum component FlaG (FlaF/FlaG flagellin family)
MGDGVDSNPGVILRGYTEGMKRKLYFIAALMLTAVVTGGTYAYTYATTSITPSVTAAEGDIATINDSETQPDWESILIPVEETEVLGLDGTGNTTQLTPFPGTGEENWEDVDDPVGSPDDDTTRVQTDQTAYQKDTYTTANHSEGHGDITKLTVYFRAMRTDNTTGGQAQAVIRTYDTDHEGSVQELTTSYADYSAEWTSNPTTSDNWTWSEVDALEAGISLKREGTAGEVRCTQVYVVVTYEYIPLSGDVPTGDLFEIIPHDDYTGDLTVKVYLANTGSLTKAYQSLDMELYLEGSVEAGKTPNYRLLTLNNGATSFTLIDEGGISHTLSVTGGDYYLISDNVSAWEEGWSVTPELYCEATQR